MKDAWMQQAACKEVPLSPDSDPFFPTAVGRGAAREAARGIAICSNCDVRMECSAHARKHHVTTGVFAGVLRNQKLPPPRSEIAHGTDAGYKAHTRTGQTPCWRCRDAHRVAHYERRERRT